MPDQIRFVWDKNKAVLNNKKHSISFNEAQTVFYDDNARLIFDQEHSKSEERFILLGMSIKLNILVVVHCYKESKELIRIISARKATKNESKKYKEYLK